MDEIEIEAFRADTKASKGLTVAHIQAAASSYDPDKNPAPLVFGHPTNDSPALGVISGARVDGSKLFLKLKNVADAVVSAVKERRIINRSIAFWAPDHPSNPTPGKYGIRHLGLLGGMAPAIPGMEPLRFSADELILESPEGPEAAVIFSLEPGPEATPLATIHEPAPAGNEGDDTMPTAEELKAAEERATKAESDLAALQASNKEREEQFAASELARRTAENGSVLDKAITDGKLLPAEKDDFAKLFEALDCKALAFSSGEKEPRQVLAAFLDTLPKRTPGADGKPLSPVGEFSADDAKAKADKALEQANAGISQAWKAPAKADA